MTRPRLVIPPRVEVEDQDVHVHVWRPKQASVILDSSTGRYVRSRYVVDCECGERRETDNLADLIEA